MNLIRNLPKMFTRSQRAGFSSEGLKVLHDSGAREFRVNLDNHKAFLSYNLRDKVLDINHTEVPEVFRGKGVAKLLVLEAFDYVQTHGLKMRIYCDYAEKVFRENQEKYGASKL